MDVVLQAISHRDPPGADRVHPGQLFGASRARAVDPRLGTDGLSAAWRSTSSSISEPSSPSSSTSRATGSATSAPGWRASASAASATTRTGAWRGCSSSPRSRRRSSASRWRVSSRTTFHARQRCGAPGDRGLPGGRRGARLWLADRFGRRDRGLNDVHRRHVAQHRLEPGAGAPARHQPLRRHDHRRARARAEAGGGGTIQLPARDAYHAGRRAVRLPQAPDRGAQRCRVARDRRRIRRRSDLRACSPSASCSSGSGRVR